MTMDEKVRSSYWDNLKGMLILMVVCGHLCERYIDESGLLRHLWILIYSFHMPLFVFVNGYFARKSSQLAEKKSIKMLKYYLLMQLLFVFGNWLIQSREFRFSFLAEPAYCCWYLLFLVYAYLLVKFLPAEPGQMVKWVRGSLLLSLAVGFDVSVGHAYGIGRTFYFLPFFFLGVWWADSEKEIRVSWKQKIFCVGVAGIIFGVLWRLGDTEWFNRSVFSGYISYEALYPEHEIFAFLNKVSAYAVAIVIGCIILIFIPKKKTFFCFLGRHTLLIYLVHIFVFPMEFYLIRDIRFFELKELNSVIILLILLVSVAVICYIFGVMDRMYKSLVD